MDYATKEIGYFTGRKLVHREWKEIVLFLAVKVENIIAKVCLFFESHDFLLSSINDVNAYCLFGTNTTSEMNLFNWSFEYTPVLQIMFLSLSDYLFCLHKNVKTGPGIVA